MSSSLLLAIDPGTSVSGYVLVDAEDGDVAGILQAGVADNADLLAYVRRVASDGSIPEMSPAYMAYEMIASYGMAVGREVFETCVYIGRLVEAWEQGAMAGNSGNSGNSCCGHAFPVFRRDVKLDLCGSMRAKDVNVRQALLDKFGPPGTKARPGMTHGVKSHAWSALAVAVVAARRIADEKKGAPVTA